VSATFDHPSRREPERAADRSLIVDRTATVRFLALSTLVLAQTFDLATFQWMVRLHGLHAEANPIVRDLFQASGWAAVVGIKVALVVLIGSLFVAGWYRRDRYSRVFGGGLPMALAIVAGLIGGITNAATILR
jgi:hypothetical protein